MNWVYNTLLPSNVETCVFRGFRLYRIRKNIGVYSYSFSIDPLITFSSEQQIIKFLTI